MKKSILLNMVSICFLLSFFAFIGCEKSETLEANSDLCGYWKNPQYNDTVIKFERSNDLPVNNYGFEIKSNGKFIERNIAGFCATPPVTYDSFEGEWNINDSIINFTIEYYGRMQHYKWKLIDINNDYLTIIKIFD